MKWLNSLKIKENPHGIEHVRITIWCPLTEEFINKNHIVIAILGQIMSIAVVWLDVAI